jgi:hypothetical protein
MKGEGQRGAELLLDRGIEAVALNDIIMFIFIAQE